MPSVYQKRGRGTWYLRVKGAAGRWADIASTAQTKTEARRLAAELERKAERQRLGLEPLPTDCTLSLGQLVGWWLRVGPNPILETEPRRVPKRVHPTLRADEIAQLLGRVPPAWRSFTATAIF